MKLHRLLVLTMTVPALMLVAGPARAAGTCQGQPATIESAGGTVTGTEGPDVILVTGPAQVAALGGDDTICVAGGDVDAGAGNDRVSAAGVHGQTAVLGAGDDSYVSVGLIDLVDPGVGDSAGTDVIDTGQGRTDAVRSGVAGEPNHDHVTTDQFSRGVELQAPAGSHVVLDGGGPIELDVADTASYVVDGTHGTLVRDGTTVATYDVETHIFDVAGSRARFTVHGSDAADYVSVRQVAAFRGDLGHGSDSVYLYPGSPRNGRIDGGPGRNWLYARAKDSAVGDLARDRLTLTSDGRVSTWRIPHFGILQTAGRRIDLRGSSAGDLLIGFGCDVTLRGLGGKDALVVGRFARGWPPASRCPGGERGQHGHVYGGADNDELDGGEGADVLVGGPGKDLAIGYGGADHCEAEQTSTC